jgi:hypothetical protein
MTKEQFLKRCETAWDMGLINEERLDHIYQCLDFVMRLGHTFFSNGQSQGDMVWGFLENERQRIIKNKQMTLASDSDLMAEANFAAVLSHPCQLCGEDTGAWHTRRGFCAHRDEKK